MVCKCETCKAQYAALDEDTTRKGEMLAAMEKAENPWSKSVDAETAQKYQMTPEELEKWYLNMAAYYRDEAAKLSASVTDEEKAALNEQRQINENLAMRGSFLPESPGTFLSGRPSGGGSDARVGGTAKSFNENQADGDAWLSSGPNGHVGGTPRVYAGDVSGPAHGLVGGRKFRELLGEDMEPRRIREKGLPEKYPGGGETDPIKQFYTWQKEPLEPMWKEPIPGPEESALARVGTSPDTASHGDYGMPLHQRAFKKIVAGQQEYEGE